MLAAGPLRSLFPLYAAPFCPQQEEEVLADYEEVEEDDDKGGAEEGAQAGAK